MPAALIGSRRIDRHFWPLASPLDLLARRVRNSPSPPRSPAKSLLLAVTQPASSLVAVGDRGHILLSKDDGRTWHASAVPTRAMLTGVSFPDARHGWAVGHDGVHPRHRRWRADLATAGRRRGSGNELPRCAVSRRPHVASRSVPTANLSRTTDGGKTWNPRTRPKTMFITTASPGSRTTALSRRRKRHAC